MPFTLLQRNTLVSGAFFFPFWTVVVWVAKAYQGGIAMLALHSSVSFFLITFLSWAFCSASEDGLLVNTTSGPIKGKFLTVGSGSVTAYLGIPYAEPPLGELRFRKPRPHQPWSQVLEATDFGNACPQMVMSGLPSSDKWAPNRPQSENCLFLNIWAPHPRPSTPIPILVWIHGGGFLSGASSLDFYNGASLAVTEDVIVASINYRLGALGFLYLPPAVPGNMGLWDQHLALTWIKENAAAFGGDPNRVTLVGHSAGGISVGYHLLSPSSQPLFARAVLQSGVPDANWAWVRPEEVRRKSLLLSQMSGCREGNESEIVTCLQGKNATKFPQLDFYFIKQMKYLFELPFSPTTDGGFLPDSPDKLLEVGRVPIKSILIGFSSDEASLFVLLHLLSTNQSQISQEQFLQFVRPRLQNATVQTIVLKYTEDHHDPEPYRSALSQALGDKFFVCPAAEFAAKIREAGSPVYAYYFTHRTSSSLWPEWIGAPHGAEIPYLFGTLDVALAVNETYTEAEAALSRRVMQYWAEFARSGNPSGSETNEVAWPLYDPTQHNFFHLSTEPPAVLPISPARHCDLFKRYSTDSEK